MCVVSFLWSCIFLSFVVVTPLARCSRFLSVKASEDCDRAKTAARLAVRGDYLAALGANIPAALPQRADPAPPANVCIHLNHPRMNVPAGLPLVGRQVWLEWFATATTGIEPVALPFRGSKPSTAITAALTSNRGRITSWTDQCHSPLQEDVWMPLRGS